MLKYLSKFALDILPSVAATIIGAYIVNHYIVSKPGADAPVAAAVSTAAPKSEAKGVPEAARPAETSADLKAKPGSEKAAADKPADKSTEKPAETASIPADTRRHPSTASREKAVRVILPAPVQPAQGQAAPAVASATPPPSVEAAVAPDDRRDANDLARAAIERLRGGNDNPRAQEAARPEMPRAPEASHIPEAPRMVSAPVRPLPPPIMVSTPGNEPLDPSTASSPVKPPYAASVRIDDPLRPTPPADIPASRPLDLRAEGGGPMSRDHTSVAEDMLSAAKSVFHAVLPK